MVSSRLLFLFLVSQISIHLLTLTVAQPSFVFKVCNDNENYTADSTYKTNLDRVLSSISNPAQYNGGFYNFSAGQDPDAAYAIALCRSDMAAQSCYSCLNDSTHELIRQCPHQKQAIGWYDKCMLRYSNLYIFGSVETSPAFGLSSLYDATDVDKFNQVMSSLLNGLAGAAASGGPLRKFETGNASVADYKTMYALVQCTPDLTEQQCLNCLGAAFEDMADRFAGKMGGRMFLPSCNFEYEKFIFYGSALSVAVLPPPNNTTNSTAGFAGGDDKRTSRPIIIIFVLPFVIVVVVINIVILAICIFLRLSKRRKKVESNLMISTSSQASDAVDDIKSVESLQFQFKTIKDATDNFSDANKLGKGGFGVVYKGRLGEGQDIAVKRPWKDSGQALAEFKNEVLLLAKLQHRNLIRLLGFCLKSNEKLLVYEFVPNKSLDYFIFDPVKREDLDWERRYKIIGGIARGLLYLHEDSRLRIIHRDLKASNVLLDADMNPKISDFGTARLFVSDQTQGNTMRIVGTYGYMAPEYAMHGHFSVKSDVFSFGVMVLEILSGQKNNSFHNSENEDLLNHAWRNWREGTALNVVDPVLRTGSSSEKMRCIHIALLCVQNNVSDRPTMNSVAHMLSSYSLTLPLPSQPVFYAESNMLPLDYFSSQDQTSVQL